MLKHWMDWVLSVLEQNSRIDKFNQVWVMMAPYPGFAEFHKPYICMIGWSGNKMRALRHVIVPVFVATLQTLRQDNWFPLQKPCCALRTLCIFNLWHSTGTILRLQLSTLRIICDKIIVRGMFSVNSVPVHQQRRFWKPSKRSIIRTNKRKGRVSPTRNNPAAAAKGCRIDEYKTHIKSKFAQHLLD